jgi:Skp family chaperone for outer membrane proteins
MIAALGFGLVAAPVFAQAAGTQQPPTTPPATQQPPTTQPPAKPAAQPPAKPAEPPAVFPEGAKVAYVDVQFVASNSEQGKVASGKLEALNKKKLDELAAKNKELEAARAKLAQGATVLSQQAASQLEKEIEKMARELQFAQQDAQNEVNDLRQNLLEEFQTKLNPILEDIRKEKGLHMIFSVAESGLAAADRGLDLSPEVIKRLDASAKAAPKK